MCAQGTYALSQKIGKIRRRVKKLLKLLKRYTISRFFILSVTKNVSLYIKSVTKNVSPLKRKIKKAKEEQKTVKEMQIEAEREYYKQGSISKDDFKKLIQNYKERMAKAKEIQKKAEEKLEKKLKSKSKK